MNTSRRENMARNEGVAVFAAGPTIVSAPSDAAQCRSSYQWRKWAVNNSKRGRVRSSLLCSDEIDAGLVQHMSIKKARINLEDDDGSGSDKEARNPIDDFSRQLKALCEQTQHQDQLPQNYPFNGEDRVGSSIASSSNSRLPFICDGKSVPPPMLRRDEQDVSCSGWQPCRSESQKPSLQEKPNSRRRLLFHRDASLGSYKSLSLSCNSSLSSLNAGSAHSAKSLPAITVEPPHHRMRFPAARQGNNRHPLRRSRSREAAAA